MRSWQVPWSALRDRLLSNPRFRHWAAGFAPTRPIARRRAQALFDLVAGFVYSQVLLACVRLELFEHLAHGPLDERELQRRLGLDAAACERLLAAAAALELTESRGERRWGLGPLGALLVGDRAIVAMVEHHGMLYADLADPVAMLRGAADATRLADFWAYAGTSHPSQLPRERVADYSALMSASQPLLAEQVLDAVDLRPCRRLMDVGGGEGEFLAAAARRAPHLGLMLFDVPAVAERARTRLQAHGLATRCDVHGGDFVREPLPHGADVVSLVRVVHDHDDAPAMALLRAVHAALPARGTLLLAEPMAGTRGARRMGDAYFGFYLAAMRSGRPRTVEQLTAMLQAAGFDEVGERTTRQPLQTRVLVARAAKPRETPGAPGARVTPYPGQRPPRRHPDRPG
jgi:demethylspheroidene O-methyltransferase